MLWLGYCYTPSTVSRNPRTRLICVFTLAYIERLTVFNNSELIITFKIKTCLLVTLLSKIGINPPVYKFFTPSKPGQNTPVVYIEFCAT